MTTRKTRRRHSRKQRQGISTKQILIIVAAAVMVVVLLVILNSNRPQTAMTDLTYATGLTSEGEPYKGSPDAPLKLEEFSDFLCGHCGDFADALGALGPDYIETGKVQVIFRNFAFLAPESIQAAQAAECALDQGSDKFWQYHDLLYAKRGTGLAAYSKLQLKAYARQIGLDTTTFNNCLDSGAKAQEVRADLGEGQSKGVQSTPTWFLNDQMQVGGVPEEQLRKIFDSQSPQGS